jgi:carbon starvation protein
MRALYLVLLAVACLVPAYVWYGRFLVRRMKVDPNRPTPAHTMTDGVDYVPAKAPVLLGHHFASIAGASPIVGPIFAAVFGWVPVFLWAVFGSIFVGGVHDFASIMASVRHKSKSIGEIIHQYIGDTGKKLFLIFAWSTLVLVIAVFMILVARTFNSVPASATSSSLFLVLAVFFGIGLYRWNMPIGPASFLGVIILLGCIALGILFPVQLSVTTWTLILLGYIFVASVTPVWILLQPRDYLNSFLLYILIFGAGLGIMISNPVVHLEPITTFKTSVGYMFPLLFVTVACGAVSGFHSMVASGTTSKQLDKETDARPVAYGGMLIEGMLAVVSLIAAAVITSEKYQGYITGGGGGPITLFSESVGGFIASLGIPVHVGTTFAALAVSAFALTSLDTATRLARFCFQEFFEGKTVSSASRITGNRFVATGAGCLFAGALALSGEWQAIWPIFGSANQLMAALALLAASVWLAKIKIKNGFLLYPMYFMFAVTISALIILIVQNITQNNIILTVLAFGLLFVALMLAWLAFVGMRKSESVAGGEAPAG